MTRFTAAVTVSTAFITLMTISPVAVAHEAPPNRTSPTATSAWSEPLDALGGITLAEYVGRHQERVLGTPGV